MAGTYSAGAAVFVGERRVEASSVDVERDVYSGGAWSFLTTPRARAAIRFVGPVVLDLFGRGDALRALDGLAIELPEGRVGFRATDVHIGRELDGRLTADVEAVEATPPQFSPPVVAADDGTLRSLLLEMMTPDELMAWRAEVTTQEDWNGVLVRLRVNASGREYRYDIKVDRYALASDAGRSGMLDAVRNGAGLIVARARAEAPPVGAGQRPGAVDAALDGATIRQIDPAVQQREAASRAAWRERILAQIADPAPPVTAAELRRRFYGDPSVRPGFRAPP